MGKSALRASGSTRQWRKIRERVLRSGQFICVYCGQEADTVDHVVPRRLGGNDCDDNNICNMSIEKLELLLNDTSEAFGHGLCLAYSLLIDLQSAF